MSLNLYTYCHNEPIMYTDPTGHVYTRWDNSHLDANGKVIVLKSTQDWYAAQDNLSGLTPGTYSYAYWAALANQSANNTENVRSKKRTYYEKTDSKGFTSSWKFKEDNTIEFVPDEEMKVDIRLQMEIAKDWSTYKSATINQDVPNTFEKMNKEVDDLPIWNLGDKLIYKAVYGIVDDAKIAFTGSSLEGHYKNDYEVSQARAMTVINASSLFMGGESSAVKETESGLNFFKNFFKKPCLAKAEEMPLTGVERFDQLAIGTEKFNIWKSNLKNRGYEVIEKELKSGNPANIVDNIVEIDPNQFRYIDMLHEKRHIFQDMVSMKQTGNTILNQRKIFKKSFINIAENDAYRYELSLANKYGFSNEYSNYLRGMISEYSPWIRQNATVNSFIERLRYYKN